MLFLPAACTTSPRAAVNDRLDLENPLSGSNVEIKQEMVNCCTKLQ